MQEVQDLLMLEYKQNTFQDYLIALSMALGVWLGLLLFKTVVIRRFRELSRKTETKLDDIIADALTHINFPFYLSIALYVVTQYLTIDPFIQGAVRNFTLIVVSIYIGIAVKVIISRTVEFYFSQRAKKDKEDKDVDQGFLSFIKTIVQIGVWLFIFIFILQNVGYNISALVGGLGIAGIAIAFSLQNVLSDLFSYISIFFDKPFKVGDFIIIGDDMGVVKNIGIKSTRIRTLQGQELIMTNKELTESRINNYRRMQRRRVVFQFGVVYDTSPKQLRKIPEIIEEIMKEIEVVDFDRAHFFHFGDSSLDFEVVYYVNNKEYNVYMDCQQKINLELMERLAKEGVEFAYPTQTVYVHK